MIRWILFSLLLVSLASYGQSGEYHVVDGIPQRHFSYSLKREDGSIIILNQSYYHDTVTIQKIDSVRNVLIFKTFYSTISIKSLNAIYGARLFNSRDGGFFLLYPTLEKIYSDTIDPSDQNIGLVKFDANLNLLWKRKFGGKGGDPTVSAEWSNSLVEQKNGMIYIYGISWAPISGNKTSAPQGQSDGWLLKLDINGNKLWDKTYGGSSYESFPLMVAMTDTSLLLITASRSPVSGTRTQPRLAPYLYDVLFDIIDTNGSILQEMAKFPSNLNNYLYQSIKTRDNGVLLHLNDKLIKLNTNLDSIWTFNLISSANYFSHRRMDEQNYGEIVASARVDTLKLFKLDLNGNILWNQVFHFDKLPTNNYATIENLFYFNDKFVINTWYENLKNEYQVGDTTRDTSFLLWLSKESCTLNPSVYKTDSTMVCYQTKVNYQWLNCDSNMKIIPSATAQLYKPMKSGRYACVIRKGACVDTTVCINFIMFDSCAKNPVNTKILKSDSGMLCEDAKGIYQWLSCDSGYKPILNATKRNYQPTKDGLYAVDISKGTCRDTSACVYYIFSGINDLLSSSDVSIYPNPAKDLIYIESNHRVLHIKVYDLMGKQVLTEKLLNRAINIKNLTQGLYLLKLLDKSGSELKREKLIIQRD